MKLRTNPFRKRKASRTLAAALALGSMVPTTFAARNAAADPTGGAATAGIVEIISAGAAVVGTGIQGAQASVQGDYKHPEINEIKVSVDPAGIVVGDQGTVIISVGGSFGSCDETFDSYKCGSLKVDMKTESNPSWRRVFRKRSRGSSAFSYTRQAVVEGWKDGPEKATIRVKLRGEDNHNWYYPWDANVTLEDQESEKRFTVRKPFVLEGFVSKEGASSEEAQPFEGDDQTPAIEITHGEYVRTKLRVARYNSEGKDGKADVYHAVEVEGKDVPLAGTSSKPDYTTLIEQLHYHGAHDCDAEPVASFTLQPFDAAFRMPKNVFTNKPTDYTDEQSIGGVNVVCRCPENATGWLEGKTDIIVGEAAGTLEKRPQPKDAPPSTGSDDTNSTEPRYFFWKFLDWYQSPHLPRKVGMIDPRTGARTELRVASDGTVSGEYMAPEYAILDVDAGPEYRNIYTLIHTPSMAEHIFNLSPEVTPAITGAVPNVVGGDVYLLPGDAELQEQALAWLSAGGDPLDKPEWLDEVPSDFVSGEGTFDLSSSNRLEMGELSRAALLVHVHPPFGRKLAKGNYRLIPVDISGKEPIALGSLEGFELAPPQAKATSTLAVGQLYYTDGLTGKKLPLSYTKFVVRDAETEKVIATPATDKYGRIKLALPTAHPVVMTLADPEAATMRGLAAMRPLAFQLDDDLFIEEREAGQMSAELQELDYDGRAIFVAGKTNGAVRGMVVAVNGEVVGKVAADGGRFEGAVKVGRLDGSAKVQVFQVFKTHTGAPATRILDLDDKFDAGDGANDPETAGCSMGGSSGRGGLSVLLLLGCAAFVARRRRRELIN